MIFKNIFNKARNHNLEVYAKEIGSFGEKKARNYLRKHGYKVIHSDIHAGNSELDIVALKNNVLVFVEVKTRSIKNNLFNTRPADAVNKSKISYLKRGASKFCKESGNKYSSYFKRFDIIEVYVSKSERKLTCEDIKHFENAF